jgi:hypothetical protein
MLWGAAAQGGGARCSCGVIFGIDPQNKTPDKYYAFYGDAGGSETQRQPDRRRR